MAALREHSLDKKNEFEARVFLRHPDMRIVGLRAEKASSRLNVLALPPAAPKVPAETGQKAKEPMKRNQLLKTVVLGLAVLLASSAFAISKGSLHVQEPLAVNGQQLAPGDYQLRWEGTGSNVEVSFLQGGKEVVKASARVITLDRPYNSDSTVVDHSGGQASVSEVRFGGKKYALAIGKIEKAEMSAGSSK